MLWTGEICGFRETLQYLRRPPAITVVDKLVYLIAVVFTGVVVLPYSIFTKKRIKACICDIFPKFMLKDILINFRDIRYIARKGKCDIWILTELSEPFMIKYFKPKEGEIGLDIGAHVGKYALYAAKLVGDKGTVIAVEASSANFLQLLKNIRINGFKNIITLNYAAFNCDNESLQLSGNNDGSLSVKHAEKKNHKSIEIVETKMIDTILQETGHINSVISYAKIDVEGAEVEVLKGMNDTIRRNPNIKFLIEVRKEKEKAVKKILQNFVEEDIFVDNPRLKEKYFYKLC
jgi:FkbM family methyltransferase